MALQIISPVNSFVQFAESSLVTSCHFEDVMMCLPIFEDSDLNFQFFVTGEASEIDALCDKTNDLVTVGLVDDCSDELRVEFTEKPERYRLNDETMLYNWSHGLPGATAEFDVGQCFSIKVDVNGTEACSNCLQRIGNSCDTSILDFWNDENFAGYNYCGSGSIDGTDTETDCRSTIIEFTNDLTRAIPYTTSMKAKYGDAPTVQVYILNPFTGILEKANVEILFDTNPVNQINIDFGGNASGIIIIR